MTTNHSQEAHYTPHHRESLLYEAEILQVMTIGVNMDGMDGNMTCRTVESQLSQNCFVTAEEHLRIA